MTRVYGYMAAGLGLTALTSLVMLSSPTLMQLVYGNRIIFYGALLAELALVWAFTARVAKASTPEAVAMLTSYAVLNGVTLSGIFLIYTASSIMGTFVSTAGMFGAMSLFGIITKRDLTGWGAFGMMGVVGLVIAMVVNIFLQSSAMGFIISVCGVVAFVALTAYDTNKILKLAQAGERSTRAALSGALNLYLDFVNLFLFLLRLVGDRR